jgi:hypothetical protein
MSIAPIAEIVNAIWCAIERTQWQSVYFAIRFDALESGREINC